MNSSDTKDIIIDFITGRRLPNVGAEANRQQVERMLVETKGYHRKDVEVDTPIIMSMGSDAYQSKVDLVVNIAGHRYMVIKCAPGSLASREREVTSAARLLDVYQIPLAVASDGRTAMVWDTVSGKKLGEGLAAVPTKKEALNRFDPSRVTVLAEDRRTRQQLIYRSYDSMNIHR